MSALVTGATGFLGRYLTRQLSSAGRPVTAVVRAGSDRSALSGLAGVSFAVHDGTAEGLAAILEAARPSCAFHLAAASPGDDSGVDAMVRTNALLAGQLAQACVRAGTPKLVAAGTFFERMGGTADYDPVSLYAATKRAGRDILEFFARSSRLEVAWLTLYDIYGPDDRRPKLANLLALHADGGEPLALSPGEQVVDLIHVEDAASAFLAAERGLDAPRDSALRDWCVSGGERMTVRALVARYREATGLAPRVKFGGRPYRAREVMSPWSGPGVPGWSPKISLSEGLRRVYGRTAD